MKLHYSSVLAFQISEQCLKNSKSAKVGLSTNCAFKIVTTVSNWKRILWVSLCLSQSVSMWTCACDWLCEKALFFLEFLCLNHKTHYFPCQTIYFKYCNRIFILIALMNKTTTTKESLNIHKRSSKHKSGSHVSLQLCAPRNARLCVFQSMLQAELSIGIVSGFDV